MSRIGGRDTRPELRLRAELWRRGLRYRLNARPPVGRPDVAFPGQRVAVFVDGCFWHGCPAHYVRPRTREVFWSSKLVGNVQRDRTQTLTLEAAGWCVVRVWEHEVDEDLAGVADRIAAAVAGQTRTPSGPEWRVVLVEALPDGGERRHLAGLRDPERVCIHDGPRITTKWKRPVLAGGRAPRTANRGATL